MKPRSYCYFCRKYKKRVKRVKLHFAWIHICPECTAELIPLLEQIIEEGSQP